MSVEIDASNQRLVLTDLSASGSAVFRVSALNNLRLATATGGLALVGEDADGDGVIYGGDIFDPMPSGQLEFFDRAPVLLSGATALSSLNVGAGVLDLGSTLDALEVRLRASTTATPQSFRVKFNGVSTLADAVTRIETASRSIAADANSRRVAVELDATADRIILRDLTSGTGTFQSLALNGLRSAAGLGFQKHGEFRSAAQLLFLGRDPAQGLGAHRHVGQRLRDVREELRRVALHARGFVLLDLDHRVGPWR